MADANVMLRIGSSMGPGGLASLKAGWDMLSGFVGTVTEAFEELDKFKVVLNQVDMGMVNYADSAARGQVDTFELMKGLQRLNKAGAEVTAEQFKIMTVRAVDLAQATGQDATAAFERLTRGIAKGSSRALTEYGVRVKESTDLHKVQKDSIDQVTDGFDDLKIALETDTQRITELGNAWGTAKGLIWDALTSEGTFLGDAIEMVSSAINEVNASLTTMNSSTRSYLYSMESGVDSLKLAFAELLEVMATVSEAVGSDQMTAGFKMFAQSIRSQIAAKLEERGVHRPGVTGVQEPDKPPQSTTAGMGVGRRGLGGRGKKKEKEPGGPSGPSSSPYGRFDRREIIDTREGVSTEGEYAINAQEQADAEERLIALKQREYNIQQGIAELKQEEMLSMREAMVDHEQRLALLQDEEYIEARMAQMREEDEIYQAEREIYMALEREQALDFAHSFHVAWTQAYKTISAGANAARYTQDLLKQSWASYVTNVITGVGSLKSAMKEILIAIGIRIAIEEGWLALKDAAAAVSALARQEYDKAAELAVGAALHAALAGIAGGAAGAASRIGSGSATARARSGGVGGGATPSYGGNSYSGGTGERQKVEIFVTVDDSANIYAAVKNRNRMERNAGGSAFAEDDAA